MPESLKTKTVQEWMECGVPTNARVQVSNGRLELKMVHSNFFQIRLQLLITQAYFCDFVLYSNFGPPNIKRVYSNLVVQKRIFDGVKKFWYQFFFPNFF